MDSSPSLDELFRVAVSALDAGDASALDYALRLVSWSWIARQCGVQISLIDVLVDAGAALDGNPDNALVNSNFDAAAHLVARGAPLTLSTALCLERWNDARRLATGATERQKQFALTLAALKGKAEALRRLLAAGVEVNGVSQDAAGADLRARDTAYHGTPLGWAEYSSGKSPYDEIAAYLRKRGAPA